MQRTNFLYLLAAVAMFALAATGCGEQAVAPPAPRPVYTFPVPEPSDLIERSFSGSLEAAQGANLSFEIPGRIVSLPAKEGKQFKKGAVIAALDCTQNEMQLLDLKAQFQRAAEDLKRRQALFESGNASKQDLDEALATRTSAKAKYDSAQETVSDCTLRMPYTGIVGTVEVDVQQTVAAGTTVVSIQGEEGMEMLIGVPENAIEQFRVGAGGLISVSAVPDRSFDGVVTAISRRLSQSGTYEVTLRISKPESVLRNGMSGEASFEFETGRAPANLIPFECVVGSPGETQYVWVFEKTDGKQGVVKRRDVEVGEAISDGRIQILSGLEAGELVVTRGVHLLEEGTEVTLLG